MAPIVIVVTTGVFAEASLVSGFLLHPDGTTQQTTNNEKMSSENRSMHCALFETLIGLVLSRKTNEGDSL